MTDRSPSVLVMTAGPIRDVPTRHATDDQPASLRPARVSDPRYGTQRWRKVSRAVLVRAGFECRIVPGCPIRAEVADHINPAHRGMSDAEFFDPTNLRGGCQDHNILRGKAARLERELAAAAKPALVTGDYS